MKDGVDSLVEVLLVRLVKPSSGLVLAPQEGKDQRRE